MKLGLGLGFTCHNKKFDKRYSPDVRINISGSIKPKKLIRNMKNYEEIKKKVVGLIGFTWKIM